MKQLLLKRGIQLLSACALVVACSSSPKPSADAGKPECTTNADCSGGKACIMGQCSPCSRDNDCARNQFCNPIQRLCQLSPCFGTDCKVNDDCSIGQFCVQGLCLSATSPTATGAPIGSTCTSNSDCASNTCNGGECCGVVTCSPSATPVMSSDAGSTDDAGTVSDAGTSDAGTADAGAADAGDAGVDDAGTDDAGATDAGVDAGPPPAQINACASDQICDPANFVCIADLGCSSNADCGAGLACNVGSGKCVTACTTENASTVCGITQVCNSGLCVDCTKDSDCGLGLTCNLMTFSCVPPQGCSSDRDCMVPKICNKLTQTCTMPNPECLSDMDCPSMYTCQTETGQCIPGVCMPDRFEPNETLAQAAPVTTGETTGLTLCQNATQSPVGYFTIPLHSGDTIDVYVEVDTLLNFDVQILDPTGNMIGDGQYAVEAHAGSLSGNYYIRVSSTDSFITYGLRISVTRGVACSSNDTNNSYSTAKSESQGWIYSQQICPGDRDWFVVSATRGQTVTAVLASTPTQGLLDMALYDDTGTRLLQQGLGANATAAACPGNMQGTQGSACLKLQTSNFSGNRVFVEVFGDDESVANTYDLELLIQ